MKNQVAANQKGIYIVEFAIVSGVFFLMIFGAIEVARLMYTWSALDAMTQRGARIAAVCSPETDVEQVKNVAIFNGDGGGSIVPGLTAANINVNYLPGLVEVSIQNYTHQMLIPSTITGFLAPMLTAPPFKTTRPTESLGQNPTGADFC